MMKPATLLTILQCCVLAMTLSTVSAAPLPQPQQVGSRVIRRWNDDNFQKNLAAMVDPSVAGGSSMMTGRQQPQPQTATASVPWIALRVPPRLTSTTTSTSTVVDQLNAAVDSLVASSSSSSSSNNNNDGNQQIKKGGRNPGRGVPTVRASPPVKPGSSSSSQQQSVPIVEGNMHVLQSTTTATAAATTPMVVPFWKDPTSNAFKAQREALGLKEDDKMPELRTFGHSDKDESFYHGMHLSGDPAPAAAPNTAPPAAPNTGTDTKQDIATTTVTTVTRGRDSGTSFSSNGPMVQRGNEKIIDVGNGRQVRIAGFSPSTTAMIERAEKESREMARHALQVIAENRGQSAPFKRYFRQEDLPRVRYYLGRALKHSRMLVTPANSGNPYIIASATTPAIPDDQKRGSGYVNINVDGPFRRLPESERAVTMLHERTHLYGTDDVQFGFPPRSGMSSCQVTGS